MSKDKGKQIYLRGDWDFPIKLEVREEGVQMGTTFLTWAQVDATIKLLKAAKTIGKL